MRFLLVLITVAFSILLLQCKKETQDDTPVIRMANEDVFHYGYFEPGTYWVYKDSATAAEDSVYVIESSRGYDTISGSSGQNVYESFLVKLHSTFENYDYYLAYHSLYTSQSDGKEKIFMHKFNPGDTARQLVLCEIPVTVGHTLVYQNTTLTTAAFYDTLMIQSDTMYNVIKATQLNDKTQFDQPSVYYIAKHGGIVRKEFLDSGSVWELSRWNILQ